MSAAVEKVDAVREWVRDDIAKVLEEDPSGFVLGVQSVSIIEALDYIEGAILNLEAEAANSQASPE